MVLNTDLKVRIHIFVSNMFICLYMYYIDVEIYLYLTRMQPKFHFVDIKQLHTFELKISN